PEAMHPGRRVDQLHRRYFVWRSFISSACVMNVSDVPKCLASAAVRCRRLKSFSAVTTASRFVVAPVKRRASFSSLSAISIVVFMDSNVPDFGIQLNYQEESSIFDDRIWPAFPLEQCFLPWHAPANTASHRLGAPPDHGEDRGALLGLHRVNAAVGTVVHV